MYAIWIPSATGFSAVSSGGFSIFSPTMFLFDATGYGVTGYIDGTNTGAALSDVFITSPGLYYLAIVGGGSSQKLP